ncbi:MAG: citrate lyase holo-[acyl-carrier protein] synthase [Sphaerochaetaceae bacterium]
MEKTPTLAQVLLERERKAKAVMHFCTSERLTTLAFSLNIPGPVKSNRIIDQCFSWSIDALRMGFPALALKLEHRGITGPYAIFTIDSEAVSLKKQLIAFEESCPIGRFLDLDVFTKEGNQISRTELGYPERCCFLCEKNAKDCGRNRSHSVEELADYTRKELASFLKKEI